jgi:anaerobic magnesium-protoporphyrin IX monomethyl ester cyclase
MKQLNHDKVLLVHPLGYGAETAGRDISRLANIMPPVGLISIAAYLESHGVQTRVIDYYARPNSDRTIREYLLEARPVFVGLSCTTSSFLDGVRIAAMIKMNLPGTSTVMGGVHASALRERLLSDYPALDYLVVGEGEQALLDLVQSRGEGVASIKGVAYRSKGEVFFSGYRDKGMDLDSLPFPAYEKLDGYPGDYSLPIFNYPKTPNTSCLSSRGCPYTCSYCDRSVFRRSYRFNSAVYMYNHLKYLKGRFGIRHVNFYDDQFTFDRKRINDFLELLIETPLGMTFNCAVRPNHIDADLVQKLKQAGCWMISLGIETGDQELLSKHRRQVDLDELADRIKMIKRFGIRVKGLLMMGLPGETEASIRKTKEYVFSLPIDDFNLTKFTPFPGAPITEGIERFGEFENDWTKMDCMHFLFIPRGLTRERMEELHTDFYKSHYMRAKVLWDYGTMLWRSPDSWLRFLGNLRAFVRFARSNERFREEA